MYAAQHHAALAGHTEVKRQEISVGHRQIAKDKDSSLASLTNLMGNTAHSCILLFLNILFWGGI